jgi:hypothetical protein
MSKRKRDSAQADSSEQVQGMTGETTAGHADSERIARRAYELYQARGGGDGRADDDWFAAERELSNGGRRHEES